MLDSEGLQMPIGVARKLTHKLKLKAKLQVERLQQRQTILFPSVALDPSAARSTELHNWLRVLARHGDPNTRPETDS